MRALIARYHAWNTARPLATKAVTTFCVFGASDTTAQILTGEERFDPGRVLGFATCGAVITAPYFHMWYKFLDGRLPGTTYWYCKLFMDAMMAAPVYIVCLLAAQRCLADTPRWDELQQDAKALWIDGLKVCPGYQALNFLLVPPAYRLQWMNGCQFLWNIYVAYFCSRRSGANRGEFACVDPGLPEVGAASCR